MSTNKRYSNEALRARGFFANGPLIRVDRPEQLSYREWVQPLEDSCASFSCHQRRRVPLRIY